VLLHHVLAGEDGPFLVAIPGGPGFDHGHLRPGLDPLADDARLVYVDPRNTGRSPKAPLDEWTLEQNADDVAETCESVGIERAVVFGHSAGGFVALTLALRRPDLVSGVILASTTASFAAEPDDDAAPSLLDRAGPEAAEIARRLFSGDLSPETQMAFALHVAPYYAGPTHPELPAHVFSLSEINGEVAQHFFTTLARSYDVRPRLSEVTVPALVVCGSWDWVIAPSKTRSLASALAAAELLELPDAAHLAFVEEPEAFLPAARSLLARS
jgi:proline iminopeptidase